MTASGEGLELESRRNLGEKGEACGFVGEELCPNVILPVKHNLIMKKWIFLGALALVATIETAAQEYKVVTVVESIVPGGLGRSRIIEATESADSEAATTERVDGKKSDQGKVKRGDQKIGGLKETKLLNFFSAAGINFQNIASNDALITDKINNLVASGWSLEFVVSGVESDAGKQDGNGLYVTRLIFKK